MILDISETPELLMSQSEDNNNDKIIVTDDNLLNIKSIDKYMNRVLSKSDKLTAYNNQIDNQLRAINRLEKIIGSFDKIKDKVIINNSSYLHSRIIIQY